MKEMRYRAKVQTLKGLFRFLTLVEAFSSMKFYTPKNLKQYTSSVRKIENKKKKSVEQFSVNTSENLVQLLLSPELAEI